MSQTIITKAFEAWLVDKTVNAEPARPDKMIFALIPGQDENAEIDRLEGMPAAGQIRYTADITQYGALNENAVVYSVVLDTTIGNWDYNWVGLVDSATKTVLMIVHLPTQQKIKSEGGNQGNSLIRNLAMEFDGAAGASQINVTPATWMIDFSARLQSMDESRRLANVDYYGPAAFRGDGFKVTLAGSTATVAPGLGYVAGLRAISGTGRSVALAGQTGVWVDICWQGTVTGAWANGFTLRTANSLADYVDAAGYQHYVTRIATVKGGVVTDERQPFPLDAVRQEVEDLDVYSKDEANKRFLQTANHLAEIAAAGDEAQAAARNNLGVSSPAQTDKKYLQIASSLSEIATAGSKAQADARENIKVYSQDEVKQLLSALATACPHRVNDVVFRATNVSPANDYPGTAWERLPADAMIRTANAAASNILATSGGDSVTLTVNELPAHSHGLKAYPSNTAIDGGSSGRRSVEPGQAAVDGDAITATGGGKAFSVLNRNVAVMAWRRTA
jgi:hypothetical protein